MMLKIKILFAFTFVFSLVKAQSPTCDLPGIINTLTAAGFTQLNVQGQPCSMYFFNNNNLSADAAQAAAQNLGANLVSIQSQAENDALQQALLGAGFGGSVVWIGGRFLGAAHSPTDFTWLDGSPNNFLNWNGAEPNNSSGVPGVNENCMQLVVNSGQWNDLVCGAEPLGLGPTGTSVIEINLCPSVDASGPQAAVCENTPANLIASDALFGSEPFTYTWFQSPSTTPIGNGQNFSPSPSAATTYVVLAQDRFGCSDTAQIQVATQVCNPPQTTCDLQAIRNAFSQAGYTELPVNNQSCSLYFINPNSQDADQAQAAAQQLGANMAVMNDAAENAAVAAALNNAGFGSTAIWIGYKRTGIAAPTFIALDGSTGPFLTPTTGGPTPGVYQNWNPGTPEPNNNGFNDCVGGCGFIGCNTFLCTNGEQCVQIFPNSGQWNDLPCNASSISIIEVNLCPQTTANVPPSICVGEQVTLAANTIFGSPPYNYTWDNGLGAAQTVVVAPSVTTVFNVSVTDRYGCSATDPVTVTVDPNCAAPVCDIQAIRDAFNAAGGYVELPGVVGQPCSMYFVNTRSQDADLSEQQAQSLGAHLVVFNDINENVAVNNALLASPFAGQVIWIGYKRTGIAAPTFFALDGSTGPFTPGDPNVFQNWNAGEPNNNDFNNCFGGCGSIFCNDEFTCRNGEQCVQILAGADWNDLPCNRNSISVVEVNLCPVPTIVQAQPLCAGQSTDLSVTTIFGSAPYTYTWDNGIGIGNPVTVAPLTTTTFSLTVTDRYNCTVFDTVTVQVENGASTSFDLPTEACLNANVIITYTGDGSPTQTYNWDFDGGTIISGFGQGPFEIAWASPGLKNVTLDIPGSGNCAQPPTSLQITINNQFTNDFTTPDSLCQFAVANIVYTGNASPTETYNWDFDGGTVVSGTGQGPYEIIWNTPGLKNVILSVPSPGICNLPPDTIQVFVIPQPVVDAGLDQTICSGGTITLGSPPQPGFNYSWTPASNLSDPTISNPDFTFSNQSPQSVSIEYILTSEVLGCIDSDTVVITIDTALFLNVTVDSTLILCAGNSVTLTAEQGFFNYVWNDGVLGDSRTVSTAGSFIARATDANGCEYLSDAQAVVVFDKPILDTLSFSNISCFGLSDGSAVFEATGGTPSFQYFLNDAPIPDNTLSDLPLGVYSFVALDALSCSDTLDFEITQPIAPLSMDTIAVQNAICHGENSGIISLDGVGGTGPYSFSWSNNVSGSVNANIPTGTYNVTLTDANNCTVTADFFVDEPAPITVTVQDSFIVLLGNSVTIEPIVSGDAPLFFNWEPDVFLDKNDTLNPTATPFQTTTYTIRVSDNNQCEASAVTTVYVNDSIKIFIPNIFTPNGDNVNDEFYIFANGVKSFFMVIYDRWGEKVFETNDINVRWDGTFKGNILNNGVYVYHAQFVFINFTQQKKKGSVILAR